jgi:hypothetical protein
LLNRYEYLQEYFNHNKSDLNDKVYLVGTNFTSTNGALIFAPDGKGYIKTIGRQSQNDTTQYDDAFDGLISTDFFIDVSNKLSDIPTVDENGLLLVGAIGNLNDYKDMLISGDYLYTESVISVGFIIFISFLAFLCLTILCFRIFRRRKSP